MNIQRGVLFHTIYISTELVNVKTCAYGIFEFVGDV